MLQPPVTELAPAGRTLLDYIELVRRNLLPIFLIFALFLGGTALYTSRQTEVYASNASVLIRTSENAQLFAVAQLNGRAFSRSLSSEQAYTESDDFQLVAIQNAESGLIPDVTINEDSGTLIFEARSRDGVEAQRVAQAWADTYIVERQEFDIQEAERRVESIQTAIDERNDKITELRVPINEYQQRIQAATNAEQAAELNRQLSDYRDRWDTEIQALRDEIRGLSGTKARATLDVTTLSDPGIASRINRKAFAPVAPIFPSWPRNMGLALVSAFLAAVSAVAIREALQPRLPNSEEVVAALDLPLLSTIPATKSESLSLDVNSTGPDRATQEALQRLTSSIAFATRTRNVRSVMITSAVSSEGKSTIAAHLAATLTSQGSRVILIGADMRRPSLKSLLKFDDTPGIAGFLEHGEELADVITSVKTPPLGLMHIIPGGQPLHNPAETLRNPDMRTLIDHCRRNYDLVIIDAPPVLPVADAIEVGQLTDMTVLVTRPSQSTLEQSRQALHLLAEKNIEVTGLIVNGSESAANYEYYYVDDESGFLGKLRPKRTRKYRQAPIVWSKEAAEADPDDQSWRERRKERAAKKAETQKAAAEDGDETDAKSDDPADTVKTDTVKTDTDKTDAKSDNKTADAKADAKSDDKTDTKSDDKT
ncbi:MAG: polysaccharide biosynthesis tyrosine autokinase, partial [Acidimicrobiales bacterium]|nr:polysaccharide biosynthesis tyrosine autokinase [Acidimicrobiales bacterium]